MSPGSRALRQGAGLAARRPLLCLVTDRHRLCPRPGGCEIDALVTQIAAAAAAGVDLIQIRERDLSTRVLERVVRRAVDAASGTSARIIVNDRLDVAVACCAAGVHLRGDSFASDRVRLMVGPDVLVGRSVHSFDEAAREAGADAADYLIFGAVFPTASKPGITPASVEDLARAAAAMRLPVLAIGGITLDRLGDVARTGATGVAAIGLFVPPPDVDPAESLLATVHAARRAFDTGERLR